MTPDFEGFYRSCGIIAVHVASWQSIHDDDKPCWMLAEHVE